MKKRHETKNEEKSLIERSKRGEYSAFRELVSQYQSRIFSVCYGILRNREDAFDIMQDVFIKIYNSIGKFEGQSGLYSWIYRIAVNTCLDHIRRRKRKRQFFEKVQVDSVSHWSKKQVKTPEELALSLEIKDKINESIERLPAKHKAVIVLREIEGLSYQEIAKILKCSEGTVMSRLFYARKKMIGMLTPYL